MENKETPHVRCENYLICPHPEGSCEHKIPHFYQAERCELPCHKASEKHLIESKCIRLSPCMVCNVIPCPFRKTDGVNHHQ